MSAFIVKTSLESLRKSEHAIRISEVLRASIVVSSRSICLHLNMQADQGNKKNAELEKSSSRRAIVGTDRRHIFRDVDGFVRDGRSDDVRH